MGGAVVVNTVTHLFRQRVDLWVEVLAIGYVRIAVVVGVIVAEVELEVTIEIGRIGSGQFLHDNCDEKDKIHIGDYAIAVEVSVSLLHQPQAVGIVRVRVAAVEQRVFADADITIDAICQADCIGCEASPADVVVTVLGHAIAIRRALILGHFTRQHNLREEEHFTLDVLDVDLAVLVEVSGGGRIGSNCIGFPRNSCHHQQNDQETHGYRQTQTPANPGSSTHSHVVHNHLRPPNRLLLRALHPPFQPSHQG